MAATWTGRATSSGQSAARWSAWAAASRCETRASSTSTARAGVSRWYCGRSFARPTSRATSSSTADSWPASRGNLHELGLPAGHGADDQERLRTRRHRVRQRGIRRFVGQILLASEEAHERPAPLRDLVADRPAQHRIAGLERVEDRALRGLCLDVELHLPVDARQFPQMRREDDADHGSVCTSTERTAGRSRTMGAQLSPAFADPYTCPPVVPK